MLEVYHLDESIAMIALERGPTPLASPTHWIRLLSSLIHLTSRRGIMIHVIHKVTTHLNTCHHLVFTTAIAILSVARCHAKVGPIATVVSL